MAYCSQYSKRGMAYWSQHSKGDMAHWSQYSKGGMPYSCEFTALWRSWIHKNVLPARPILKVEKKKKASHMMLSQGCWVGGVWLLTFLLQDAELWPLLCRKQHCYGVIPLLWFHLWLMPLVRENNLGRMLTTSSPAWLKNVAKSCLLHWNPGLWMDNSLTSLSLASSIHTLFACYEGMP